MVFDMPTCPLEHKYLAAEQKSRKVRSSILIIIVIAASSSSQQLAAAAVGGEKPRFKIGQVNMPSDAPPSLILVPRYRACKYDRDKGRGG